MPIPPERVTTHEELAAAAEANGEIQVSTRELPEPEMLFKLKGDTWLFTEERMATIYGKLTPDRKADKDEYTALLEKGGKAMRLPAGANIIINRVYQKDIATKDSPLVICFVECLSENVEGYIPWEEANPQEEGTPSPESVK